MRPDIYALSLLICLQFAMTGIRAQIPNPTSPIVTRADSLRGRLSPWRSCFDVKSYTLDLEIDPATQSISGSNTISFEQVAASAVIQLDLYPQMKITGILLDEEYSVEYDREESVVYVRLPLPLKAGGKHQLKIFYSGTPQTAGPSGFGGFIWTQDKNDKSWIAVNCQYEGASLWWPCKDHPTDEPENMQLSIRIPQGLKCISNGRLQKETQLDNGWAQFDWYISYPINLYNVSVNIGDYVHFGEKKVGSSPLDLDYYVLPYNLEKARNHFEQVLPMMECFERMFGPYPFPRDGFKLIETPYWGMEHQSAISYGNYYLNGSKGSGISELDLLFDYIIVHETAHEWWGNSISAADISEWWIHEGMATYAEALYLECAHGYDAYLQYINDHKVSIQNKQPILGIRHVNKVGSGDKYTKGMLMLNTLRHVVNDDVRWKQIIADWAEQFRHQVMSTDQVIEFFNQKSGKNLTPIFHQYLYHTQPPQLDLALIQHGKKQILKYKWTTDVENFQMPVLLTLSKDVFTRVFPSTEWQEKPLDLPHLKDFQVAEDKFYLLLNKRYHYLDERLGN